MEVLVNQLKPADQWLKNVHFQVIPLEGVKSLSNYAILLMTPPAGGVHAPADRECILDLVSAGNAGIQPIIIEPTDFGAKGDRPVIKFIDEQFRPNRADSYHVGQKLSIGSDTYR